MWQKAVEEYVAHGENTAAERYDPDIRKILELEFFLQRLCRKAPMVAGRWMDREQEWHNDNDRAAWSHHAHGFRKKFSIAKNMFEYIDQKCVIVALVSHRERLLKIVENVRLTVRIDVEGGYGKITLYMREVFGAFVAPKVDDGAVERDCR